MSSAIICTDLSDCQDHFLHLFICQRIVERDAEDPFIKPLGVWAEPFRISEVLIVGEPVDRDIVHLTVDIFGIHGVKKLPSAAGEDICVELQDIQMPDRVRFRYLLLDNDTLHITESLIIPAYDLLPAPGEGGELFELAGEQRRLHIGEPVIISQGDHFIVPGIIGGSAHQGAVSGDTVASCQKKFFVERLIVCGDNAAFPGGDGFHRVGGKTGHVAEGADGLPFIACADGVGSVLDHEKAMFFTDRGNLIAGHGLSGKMDRDDCFCLRGDTCFNGGGIYIVGLRINIRKDRRAAAVGDAVCRCGEGDRSGDGFVAWSDTRRDAGDMQRSSSVADCHGIFCACHLTEFFFERRDLWAAG